jgi:hypothetical protein
MKKETSPCSNNAAIWQRVMEFKEQLSPAAARGIMEIEFSEYVHARTKELSKKASTGFLAPCEQDEFATFEQLGRILDILHAQAREASMKRSSGHPDS